MKVMLLHLSDLHIKKEHKHIVSRADKISDSVKNIDSEIEYCFLVISGDIAHSGSDEEYEIALEFLGNLEPKINEIPNIKGTHILVVPGNHDCCFENEEILSSFFCKFV